MSLFNKMFASIGIGSAKVDTRLERDTYAPGDEVRGIIEIIGGNTEQHIDAIYLKVHTNYVKEIDDKKIPQTAEIDKFRLVEPFIIVAKERREIPIAFQLPIDTPLTLGRTKVWIATGLDIKNAVDPSDKDYIRVVPYPLIDRVLQGINDLGFRLREVDCEQAPYRLRGRLPFIQEFEFVPVSGLFRTRLDELEIVFFPYSLNEVELVMQVDRRARGLSGLFAEALEMDETNVRVKVTSYDIPIMRDKLQSILSQYS